MNDPKISKSSAPWWPTKELSEKPATPTSKPVSGPTSAVFGNGFTVSSLVKTNTSQGSAIPQVPLTEPVGPQEITHTVKTGESLSSLAKHYLGDGNAYMDIFALNKSKELPHPNSPLKAGMKLKVRLPAESVSNAPVTHTSMWEYQKQNPMSYVSLDQTKTQNPNPLTDETGLVDTPWFVHGLDTRPKPAAGQSVTHIDAVKVNKRFDLHPTLSSKTISAQFASWATKAADILEAHQANVLLGQLKGIDGQMVDYKMDGATLRQWAETFKGNSKTAYTEFKTFLKDQLGLGAFNTLYAIDDIVNNIKHDPYFQDVKHLPKQFDLATVKDDFRLAKDSLSYTGGLLYHQHRGVPVHVQTNIVTVVPPNTTKTANEVLQDLSLYFTKQGTLKDPISFEQAVYGYLDNANTRRNLLEHFQLNSQENVNVLIPAMVSEGGVAPTQRVYNSYFAVGSVMLNRALGRNLKKSAQSLAQGIAADKIKPVKMKDIIFESGQFEITWRKRDGATRTIYEGTVASHQSYQKGKLAESDNLYQGFAMAYETVADMMKGVNRLAAEVNGVTEKGAGRSTSDLFYFNQSRSQDYSNETKQGAAVAMIDQNNTHVFFKAWDKVAYFR